MPEHPQEKTKVHPYRSREMAAAACASSAAYAELAVTSNYSFLRGASFPEELVEQAAALGYRALGIADVNTLAGIVRAHVAAKERGMKLAVGARVVCGRDGGTERRRDEVEILVYPESRGGYANLCRLLTLGKRRAPKGECHLDLHDLVEHQEGLLAVAVPPAVLDDGFADMVAVLWRVFDDDRLSVAMCRRYGADDGAWLAQVAALCAHTGVPALATNDAHYHHPERRPVQDVVSCIRHGCTIAEAGFRVAANAERFLKPPEEMERLFAEFPGAVARSVAVAERACGFSLDELKYEYPVEPCPDGLTPTAYLEREVWAGARRRYPEGVPEKTRASLSHELAFIEELKYEPYFLTCFDIVKFARSRGILCQGRGGAANSAVCYCLGLTEVDPARYNLLFERFISRARKEPPDIDIDFEHERREEVLQYIYEKYGRDRAALTAVVISYRGRSAVREVGKVMGLSADCIDAMARNIDHWGGAANDERVREIGLDPRDPTIARVIALSRELIGFPRHLSQHVGGFVIARRSLSELVPIENAAMDDRTVIEWDKDDIDAMGMLKIDCLGLGMLTAVRKSLEMVVGRDGETERRRDEVGNRLRATLESCDGACEIVSGSGGLAAGDGAGSHGVWGDAGDAGFGAVRADEPDASVGRFGAIKYCGGIRAGEPSGPAEVLAGGEGIAQRTGDAVRVGDDDGPDRRVRGDHATDRGNRPCASGPDPQPDGQEAITSSPTSSLRLSVSASLWQSLYSSIARSATDPAVYDMISHADTVGVFQVESRAQMSMLPRLRPREFYDLVIEVAIVRPGPIQGGMVHPYLRRRESGEPIHYPKPEMEAVLERTLGVPLFQEQAMQIAIVGAGFTPDEADGLRRAMAAWKRKGNAIYGYGQKLIGGMIERGYPPEFAERCFEQIKGFSEYGFPESHAASFAIIVYVSAWLKRHHPAAFCAGLINSQPMGFYAPAQLVRDAREHGVEVREVDVNRSGWDCSLEETERRRDEETEWVDRLSEPMRCIAEGGSDEPSTWGLGGPAVRLGMRLVKGLREDEAAKIAAAVATCGPFDSVERLWRVSGVSTSALRALARADTFGSMGLDRQAALWAIRPLRDEPMPLFEQRDAEEEEIDGLLPEIEPHRRVLHDYGSLGLSLKAHPVSFMRESLAGRGVMETSALRDERACPGGRIVKVGGIVLCRQRPGTASGVVFVTLEDETGIANLILWPKVFERFRRVVRLSTALLAQGRVERKGEVVHVHVTRVENLDEHLPELVAQSRDFH